MSTAKYPNRDALREANDIYLDAMRPFVVHYLKRVPGETVEYLIKDALKDEQADDFWEKLDEDDDIESAIDFSYFPLIIQGNWIITRNKRNYGFAQQFKNDMNVQSMLWLIRKGRNACEHRGTKDLDFEFVRINLFLIADVLGKINRPDKQHEVETIRDKLDDTAERLAEAEERLKAVETESSDYKASLLKVEECLEAAESEKNKYEGDNATLSNQVDEKERRLKKLSGQLKRAKTERDKNKKNLAGAKKRLKESESARADYKGRFETTSKELKNTKADWKSSEERLAATSNELAAAQAERRDSEGCLAATRNLLTTVAINDRSIFPALDTDSPVRILDRRGTDKRNYLLGLLEQKRSTIIYVQNEEKIDLLLTRVLPEKADVIGRHDAQTSDGEEMEILEKLENGELIAVVSNTMFSALTSSHPFEHFIFCHLVPGLDKFFKQCEPAFTLRQNTYLHLIYDSEQDIEGLVKKYLDRETLGKLYAELEQLSKTNGDFINPENVYDELDMAKQGIETGLAIFEELRLLERNEMGVKLLLKPKQKRELDESETYCAGEELKQDVANFRAFQLEKSIEEIWAAIKEKVDIDDEQILRESDINKISPKVPEIESNARSAMDTGQYRITPPIEVLKDFQAQSEQSTEAVENDNAVGDGTAEVRLTPKSSRANAKVTEEQVREIRSRSAAGESYNQLSREYDVTSAAVRNIVLRNTWKDVE